MRNKESETTTKTVTTFENIRNGHIFFDLFGNGIYRSVNEATTYTLEEALKSKELISHTTITEKINYK